ncbi:MAG: carbohydrate deacetylase [Culicoidibacterales bacterium]
MGKVIINADDFGYSRAVNFGIIDTFTNGILTSATIMANMKGFDHAVSLAKAHPQLGIGVHLTLTCGNPILADVPTLVSAQKFRKLAFYQEAFSINLEELYREWDAQIQKVYASGLRPTHLDSHHHIHTFGENASVMIRLAKKYDLPVRGNFLEKVKVKHTDMFEEYFDIVGMEIPADGKSAQKFNSYLNNLYNLLKRDQTIEIMCHPAYIDVDLMSGSKFVFPRINQVEFLINSEFSRKVQEDEKIELVNYRMI